MKLDKATKIPLFDSSGRDLFKLSIFKCIFILISELRIFKVDHRGGFKSKVKWSYYIAFKPAPIVDFNDP